MMRTTPPPGLLETPSSHPVRDAYGRDMEVVPPTPEVQASRDPRRRKTAAPVTNEHDAAAIEALSKSMTPAKMKLLPAHERAMLEMYMTQMGIKLSP